MKFICLALAFAAAFAADELVPGDYTVVLKPNVKRTAIAGLLKNVNVAWEGPSGAHTFLHVTDMTPEVAARLAASPLVQIVDQSTVVQLDEYDNTVTGGPLSMEDHKKVARGPSIQCVDQPEVVGDMSIWHLIRTNYRSRPADFNDSTFRFLSRGEEADCYILDTGVDLLHPEFTGRASHSFVSSNLAGQGYEDDHGHGTHVGGLAAGDIFGVAKDCHVYNVKVLGQFGGGTTAGIIEGVVHVHNRANADRAAGRTPRAIINMSLGGAGFSAAFELAINNAVDDGVYVIAAAGNGASDTSGTWPAAYENVIAVGATDIDDNMASFSNFGPLNDINAPGVLTWAAGSRHSGWCSDAPDINNCFIAISGTSMSCPIVQGRAARHLAFLTDQAVENFGNEAMRVHLAATSTHNVLSFTPAQSDTPNRLLHRDDC